MGYKGIYNKKGSNLWMRNYLLRRYKKFFMEPSKKNPHNQIIPYNQNKVYASYSKRTCSLKLRNTILKYSPNLEDYPEHWNLFTELLYAPEHRIVANEERLAKLYVESHKLANRNFSGKDKLNNFEEQILRLKIKEYSFMEGLAREVSIRFVHTIEEEFKKELLGENDLDTQVFIETGEICNKNNIKKLENEDLLEVKPSYYEEAKFIQDYLNKLPKKPFTEMAKNVWQAKSKVYDKDDEGNSIITDPAAQLRILDCIKEQPKPIYSSTKERNTARLFSVNVSLQYVHSHIRSFLTKDWVELDLAQAHLAIVATTWNIPVVTKFLKKKINIWTSLLLWMEFDLADIKKKKALKQFLYSLIYGMSLTNLKEDIDNAFYPGAYERFIEHEVIASILVARRRKTREISKLESYTTPLGREFKVVHYKDKTTQKFESNINTIISAESSEYELMLVAPIFRLAAQPNIFKVLLYQFDGVSISARDKSRTKYVIKNIQKEVDKVAEQLGILTTLEVKVN